MEDSCGDIDTQQTASGPLTATLGPVYRARLPEPPEWGRFARHFGSIRGSSTRRERRSAHPSEREAVEMALDLVGSRKQLVQSAPVLRRLSLSRLD